MTNEGDPTRGPTTGVTGATVSGNSIEGVTKTGLRFYNVWPCTHVTAVGNTIRCLGGTSKGIESSSAINNYILATSNVIQGATTAIAGTFGANCTTTGNMVAP